MDVRGGLCGRLSVQGGGGFLSLAGWPTEGRWYAGSLGENVDEREIPKLCCDS